MTATAQLVVSAIRFVSDLEFFSVVFSMVSKIPSVLSLQIVMDSIPDDGMADNVLPWSRFDTQKSYWELKTS